MKNYPDYNYSNIDKRPPWWKTILLDYHPHEKLPWKEPTLMRDNPDEWPQAWITTLIKDNGTLMSTMRDHPDKRPPWWKTILMKDHKDEKPPW